MGEIVVRGLCKSYYEAGAPRFDALRSVSFSLKKGKCLALIGESGSGKSTIARMIMGLEKPSDGEMLLDGEHMEKWSKRQWRQHRCSLQAVFQDATGTLNPRMSVERNAQLALKNLTTLSSKERHARIFELMQLTRMHPRLMKTPTTALSGGEQRRIALIRALSIHPDFIVLDEVTSGLDAINTHRVVDVLHSYLKTYACGCLLITHDLRVADRLADQIIELSHGEVLAKAYRKNGKEAPAQ